LLTQLHFKSLSSTQSKIYEVLKRSNYNALSISADTQSNGYGQKDRKWESQKGGIYISISIKYKKKYIPDLSLKIAHRLATFLNQKFNIETKLKYPNDILLNKKKIAGILSEIKKINDKWYLIIGLGININQSTFSNPLSPNVISMHQYTKEVYNLTKIRVEIIEEMHKILSNF